jgi:hypothetical protein
MPIRRALFVLLVALPAFAQEPWCGTGETTSIQTAALHRANRLSMARAAVAAENHGGIYVVPKTAANALVERRNDLDGKSVRFVPAGPASYTTTVEALQYDDTVGSRLRVFAAAATSDWYYVKVDLQKPLSLFGGSVKTIYLTAFNSISLAPPAIGGARQYDTMEAAFLTQPTIAPLLMANNRPYLLGLPSVYLRESSDGVLVTWRTTSTWSYDVQAKISTTGEILFSYRSLGEVTWGAVVVTPGLAPWASLLTTVAQASDAENDVSAETPDAQRGQLDLRSLKIEQVPGIGVYLMTITVATPPRGPLPPRGDVSVFTITVGDAPPMTVSMAWNGSNGASQPGRTLPYTTTAGIEDNRVEIAFTTETIGGAGTRHVVVESWLGSMRAPADRMTADIDFAGGIRPGVDLTTSSGAELPLPIVDAFTLPALDLDEIWSSVRAAGFDDETVDAVAIFQNFPTDIVLYAGAFASGGNDGSDGVTKYVRRGSAWPRSPTLLHMNMTNYSNNQDVDVAGRVLLHELGHRWLQFVETIVAGSRTIVLNPSPAHPPQFASTPAAFPVKGPYDTSTMGGGWFTQNGISFTSATASAYGYSWLDLYLMGLAAPNEVPPTYWIENSNPPLAPAYTPPSNTTVTGTRRDVVFQQVLDAMGPRTPAVANSQHGFRVVFVLVASPEKAVDPDLALVDQYRRAFQENFVKATGERAWVQTLNWPPQPRHRAAGH